MGHKPLNEVTKITQKGIQYIMEKHLPETVMKLSHSLYNIFMPRNLNA